MRCLTATSLIKLAFTSPSRLSIQIIFVLLPPFLDSSLVSLTTFALDPLLVSRLLPARLFLCVHCSDRSGSLSCLVEAM